MAHFGNFLERGSGGDIESGSSILQTVIPLGIKRGPWLRHHHDGEICASGWTLVWVSKPQGFPLGKYAWCRRWRVPSRVMA